MQCPPSPLLSDPSTALENQLNKNTEIPVNVHSGEEPGFLNQTEQPGRGDFSGQMTSPVPEPQQELLPQVLNLAWEPL